MENKEYMPENYQQLENRIKELENWKAEKMKQQIKFPLDIESLEILNKYFLRIYDTADILNTDYPGETTILRKFFGKQDRFFVDFNESKFFAYSVNITTNFITLSDPRRNFKDGTVLWFATSDTAPAPIDITGATSYFVRDSTGNTFKIALTDGGVAIDITDVGVGRQFIYSYIEPI